MLVLFGILSTAGVKNLSFLFKEFGKKGVRNLYKGKVIHVILKLMCSLKPQTCLFPKPVVTII